MRENKWVTGVKFHPYKWSSGPLLTTGRAPPCGKLTWNPKNEGLVPNAFPFQLCDFEVNFPPFIFVKLVG